MKKAGRKNDLGGKTRVPSGSPCSSSSQSGSLPADRYLMPTRKPPKGKRVHSLSKNIAKGVQNAGKW